MKTFSAVGISLVAALALVSVGCGDDDADDTSGAGANGSGAGGPGSGPGGGGTGGSVLSGDITTDTTLTAASSPYLLQGKVAVQDGAVLTIEPGTVIQGEAATQGTLVIKRGARIEAAGTADAPIVFTSELPPGQQAAGDWGGLIILGRAPITDAPGITEKLIEGLSAADGELYGGSDPADNSGTLQYVRIEFSGVDLGNGNEINGLTLGAVGNGTTIDHVMVRNTLDDGFEWFGGTVNATHLIAFNAGDDYFDADEGYVGNLQFLFGISNTPLSEDPNGFEMDSKTDNTDVARDTAPTIWNVTLCGPSGGTDTGFGMVLREGFKGAINNAIVDGFDAGLSIRVEAGETNATDPSLDFSSINSGTLVDSGFAVPSQDVFDAGTMNDETDAMLSACLGTAPDGVPPADLAGGTPPSGFDASATYRGAFSASNDWATGAWVVY
ncbi:MAG: hypothetical protein AAGN82_06945 [Myxococcota bacterium]